MFQNYSVSDWDFAEIRSMVYISLLSIDRKYKCKSNEPLTSLPSI